MNVRSLSPWDQAAANAHSHATTLTQAVAYAHQVTYDAGFAVHIVNEGHVREAYGPKFSPDIWETVRYSRTWVEGLWFPHTTFVTNLRSAVLDSLPVDVRAATPVTERQVDVASIVVDELASRFSWHVVTVDQEMVERTCAISLTSAESQHLLRSVTFQTFTWFERSEVISSLRSTMNIDPVWPG